MRAATFPRPPRSQTPVRPIRRSPSSDRKSTRLNSSHSQISYAVFCLKKKKLTHNSPVSLCVKERPFLSVAFITSRQRVRAVESRFEASTHLPTSPVTRSIPPLYDAFP